MIVGNRMDTLEGNDSQPKSKSSQPIFKHALDGFLIVFFNPKIGGFFLAIFSQFLSEHQDIETKAGIVSIAWIIDTTWYLFVAQVATIPIFVKFINSYKAKIELFIGYTLILVCFVLIWRFF
jgi:threonine/homoserine/homoserine lactone efflux protein